MTRTVSGILILIALFSGQAVRGDILGLIQSGRADDALDSISDLGSTFAERGNVLFYRGLLETDADSSARLLEAARQDKVDSAYADVIAFRLAFYYLLKGNDTQAAQEATRYLSLSPRGNEALAMSRILVLKQEQEGERDEAASAIDFLLEQNPRGDARQWSLIDKARVSDEIGDQAAGVTKALTKLSQERSGPGVATAMYMLVRNAVAAKQFDDAVLYFGLLKEESPHAVGLASLADQLGDIPEDELKDSRAEQATGTYYAVKVGVFSQRANADQQADKCRVPGQPSVVDAKQISGKTYYIVYVGRYRAFAEAEQLKSKLEDRLNDSFQVVAR